MYWVIEYLNGTSISEKEVSFQLVEKNNIKQIYVMNNDIPIGFNFKTGMFFVNKQRFDFKIGSGPYFPLQFKTDTVSLKLDGTQEIKTSFNIGCFKFESNYKLKYYFTISEEEIAFQAVSEDLNGVRINSRSIKIQ